MKSILLLFLLYCINVHANVQVDDNIQIDWLNAPTTVNKSRVTLKWGINAHAQITDISISLNGVSVKGINAVSNDGYDMLKSQVLTLKRGENNVEIIVTTIQGSRKSSKSITFLGGNDGDGNHDNFYNDDSDYEDIDSMIAAAYGGEVKAQYLLAASYLHGTNGLGKDLFESSLWFKKSAESHYAPSQYEYAISLLEGRGILKNPPLAIHWLTLAAAENYAEAQLRLGLCFEAGVGVTQNIEKAKEWYHKCPLPEAKQRLMALKK